MRSPCSLGRVPTSVTTSSALCARPPAIIEDLHTIADLRDPDQIRRDSAAGATRWPRDQPWITRTMHRTVRVWRQAPAMRASRQWGPCFLRMAGGTGVRGDAATYPSTEDACRRPRSRSKRPSCSTGGCGTTCGTKDTGPLRAPNPSGRRRVAVRRLTREFDLPFRKGCPGRPRARQIGRSDAEFLRKYCVSFVLFFTSPLCFNRDRLVTRRATQRPPRWGGTATIRRHARRKESPDDTDPNTLTRHTR